MKTILVKPLLDALNRQWVKVGNFEKRLPKDLQGKDKDGFQRWFPYLDRAKTYKYIEVDSIINIEALRLTEYGYEIKKAMADNPVAPAFGIERFYFLGLTFDIAKAWWMIDQNRKKIHMDRSRVEWFYDMFLDHHDMAFDESMNRANFGQVMLAEGKEYALSNVTDLTIPVLVVVLSPEFLGIPNNGSSKPKAIIIDGWHRIYKAHHQQGATLESYWLQGKEVSMICERKK